jgi:hypothetical protein
MMHGIKALTSLAVGRTARAARAASPLFHFLVPGRGF